MTDLTRRLKTYRIRIMATNGGGADAAALIATERAVSEAEENISDLLPEGYYCKIEED